MQINKENLVSTAMVGVQAALTALQANQVFQWIQLGLTIASALITLITNVIISYRKIAADGKITGEEAKSFASDTAKAVADTSKKIDNSLKEMEKDANTRNKDESSGDDQE